MLPSGTNADLTIQTNGLLLGRELLELFDELGITAGVSLDGNEDGHERKSCG